MRLYISKENIEQPVSAEGGSVFSKYEHLLRFFSLKLPTLNMYIRATLSELSRFSVCILAYFLS